MRVIQLGREQMLQRCITVANSICLVVPLDNPFGPVVTYVAGTFCNPCVRIGLEKDWSALEDDFCTFLVTSGSSESIFQQFIA
jgi:hypothetical protein